MDNPGYVVNVDSTCQLNVNANIGAIKFILAISYITDRALK